MTNTIESLVAKQDITELIYLYMRGLDRWDDVLLRSLFTADAWCEYGFMNGSANAFIDFALGALKDHTANQHMVGNILRHPVIGTRNVRLVQRGAPALQFSLLAGLFQS